MSAYSPTWKRLLYRVPLLFTVCGGGNYHWFWDKVCRCQRGYNGLGDFVYSKKWRRWVPAEDTPSDVLRSWVVSSAADIACELEAHDLGSPYLSIVTFSKNGGPDFRCRYAKCRKCGDVLLMEQVYWPSMEKMIDGRNYPINLGDGRFE